jgi:hypothetical protein
VAFIDFVVNSEKPGWWPGLDLISNTSIARWGGQVRQLVLL